MRRLLVVLSLGFCFMSHLAIGQGMTWFRSLQTNARAPQAIQQSVQDHRALGQFVTYCVGLSQKYHHSLTSEACESAVVHSQIIQANAVRYLLNSTYDQRRDFAARDIAGRFELVEGRSDIGKLAWFVLYEKTRMDRGMVARTNRSRLAQEVMSPTMGLDRISQLVIAYETNRNGNDPRLGGGQGGVAGSGIQVPNGGSVGGIDPDCLKPVPLKMPAQPATGAGGPTGPGGGDPSQEGGKSSVGTGGKLDCSQLDPTKQGGGGQTADGESQDDTPQTKTDPPPNDGKVTDADSKAGDAAKAASDKAAADKAAKDKAEQDKGKVDDLKIPKYDDEGGFGGGCDPSPVKAVIECLGIFSDSGAIGFDPCANLKLLGMPGPDGSVSCGGKGKGSVEGLDKVYQDIKDPGKGPAGDPSPTDPDY